ncbi:MAG: hypothetical protein OEY93_06970 [Anaerolineae bacterium]|nr:hypothetical protein [Anaerolineae bacterium]
MTGPKKNPQSNPSSFFLGIANHLKLVWRLWQDPRVSPLLKLLPFGSLVYFIFPFDIPGPVDDIGVVWAFTHFFIEMCPADVVAEHRAEIDKTIISHWKEEQEFEIPQEDIIDAEYREKEEGS